MYRVMIVDDEYMIRQGIVSLVDWEALGCTVVKEAQDGEEAYDYLKESQIEIIVCDIRMPGRDGLELSYIIQEEFPGVKVILLTAYSDFTYAQQAVRYGVAEYVVKTNYIEKLPEAVLRVTEMIRKENEQKEEVKAIRAKLGSNAVLLREKVITDILKGSLCDEKEIRKRAEECEFPIASFYLISIIFNERNLQKLGASKKEKTLKAVKNFINLSMEKYRIYTAFVKNTEFVSILFWEDSNGMRDEIFFGKIKRDLEKMELSLKETLGISVNLVLSRQYDNLLNMKSIYEEIKAENSKAAFLGDYGVTVQGEEAYQETDKAGLCQTARKILEYIEQGVYGEAVKQLDVFEAEIRSGKYDVEMTISRAIDICAACQWKMSAGNLLRLEREEFSIPTYYDITACENLDELKELLTVLINAAMQLTDDQGDQYGAMVSQCIQYIHAHYYEKINIGVIADKLHVNKSYLGTVFKKETGISLVDAITQFRLNKAVELMQKTDYKLFEISEKVGFDDPAYFSNVFTKVMGISPSSYRNSK